MGIGIKVILKGIKIEIWIVMGMEIGWGVKGVEWEKVKGEKVEEMVGIFIVMRNLRKDEKLSNERKRILKREGIMRMLEVNRDIMIR